MMWSSYWLTTLNTQSTALKKGDRGIVIIDYAVQGSILVDFTRVLPDGECIGDCISVDIKDLKVVTE